MRRILLCLLAILAGACSLRGALETMTAPEDRAFAQEVVERLRRGDQAWLQRHFDPELWAQSAKQLPQVPSLFPADAGTTEITSFQTSTSVANGATRRERRFTLVTHGGGRWTVTSFQTYSVGGPDRIVQWQVVPHETAPPELRMLDAVDRALPWIWGGLLFLVAAIAALIFWLMRRSRRRRDAQSGTP
ncbi:hypothetical protein [Sphingosinicella terrae]|uniref:hypothetical protein n=1 Tax=Sphingosinicella terrae TaxID=2172047 RepID=UPI0013B3C51A|nr:hypothetical protein [Sphingosinicella terrae]